ncbi:MAG: nucleoid-associated protein [Thermotaleaceae bacterium]
MRDIEAVIIKKAIIHVLDRNADAPIYTDFEQEINEDIHEFLEKHILKALQDEDNKKAKFRGGTTTVKDACLNVFIDENIFVEASKVIANQMFKALQQNSQVSSCDLVVCLYEAQEKNYVGILKMDYKKSFIHNLEFLEDKLKISIMPQSIGLPNMGQRLQKCAFIKEPKEEDDFDLILLDKQVFQKDEDGEVAQFFSSYFLNCEILIDNRDRTKIFKNVAEKWTRKNLKEDIDKAQEFREEVVASLKSEVEIDVEKFAIDVLGNDVELQQNFIQHLNQEGLPGHHFEIDKSWVEKKLKRRAMKTDTGLEIRGDYEDFDDKMKFQIHRKGDGTVDIIIRNVRRIHER